MRPRFGAATVALFLASSTIAQAPIPGTDPNPRVPVAGEQTSDSVAVPQANVALPAAAATAMGNTNNYFGVGAANQRYQQIHDAADVGPAGLYFAHAYRMRNATYTGGTQTIEIKVGTTTVAPSAMSTNLTTNITGTQTTVFKGTYNFPNMVPNTNPADWKIIFPWSAPWPWTAPAGQHFAYEYLNSSTSNLSYFVDAFSGTAHNVSRAWGTGTTATTGSRGLNFGLAILLFDRPVPPFASFDKYGRGCPGTFGRPGVILPASMRTAMGNSNNIYGVAYYNQRYQQAFTGSEVGQARIFNGHSFRPGTRTDGPIAVANVEILMASTKNAPASLSSTFASNANGTIAQVSVFKGTINYPKMVPSTTPTEFAINVPWTSPFVWTAPANEHLLYEYTNSGTSSYGGYYPNAVSGDANVTRLYGTGPTAATGTLGTSYGVVFKFDYAGIGNEIPAIGNNGTPIIGTTFDVLLSSAQTKPGAALLLWGFSDTTWGPINLPWALDAFGAKGCSLLTSIDLVLGSPVSAAGNGSVTIAVPKDTALYKLAMFFQWTVVDPGANALGLAFSEGGKAVIGGL